MKLICTVHRRAEIVRRKIEGTLHLPVIEPVFRIKGNPDGKLNLVPLDAVADAMVSITDCGTFYLTNPEPPTLSQLADWVGGLLLLKIRFGREFISMPIEAIFSRVSGPFSCYLQGDNFISDLKSCAVIDRGFVQKTASAYLLR